jgi:hypothetical protein
MVIASGGYDLPSFEKLTTFKTWAEAGPPKGTLYHYPNPYNHQILSVAGAPAPHAIGERIYTQATQTQMAVRYFKGEPMEKTIAWAVAKRDAPKVAEQLWTHGFAAGPKGRFAPFSPYFWCNWSFSKNQSAATTRARRQC